MIALCGDPEDLTTAYLAAEARRRGLEVAELAESSLGESWSLALDDDRPGGSRLDVGGRRVAMDELSGMFVRFNPRPGLPEQLADLPPTVAATLLAERRSGLDYALDRWPCAVVNRPSAGRSNGSKPFQMQVLERAGFDVPAWRVASRAEEVLTFVEQMPHGAVHKSCSGLRSQVRRVDAAVRERLTAGAPPALVQEYVPGSDVRLHVVGERTFATRIEGAGLDYRYESEGAVSTSIEPPDRVARACVRTARLEGLVLAGFDFRVDPSGRWRCLEVNPVPTFLPYEMSTGQPIAAAVVDVLAGRTKSS